MLSSLTATDTSIASVAAIVVTFHPDAALLDNLKALRSETGRVIVVDNGSRTEELEFLRHAAATLGLELIENGRNLGIASALNIGVRHALALGFSWMLLFDQDSRISPGFTAAMLQSQRTSPWGDRLAILVPTYVDMRNGKHITPNLAGEGLADAMTSGSLIHAEIFARHGYFIDDLFIDGVDYEFSLRVRKAGGIIDETAAATLFHSPGTPKPHGLGGRAFFHTSNYSPARRYYQERNKVWVTRRYALTFPGYCLTLFVASAREITKILLGEPDKLRKLRFIARGVLDGLRNRMGPIG